MSPKSLAVNHWQWFTVRSRDEWSNNAYIHLSLFSDFGSYSLLVVHYRIFSVISEGHDCTSRKAVIWSEFNLVEGSARIVALRHFNDLLLSREVICGKRFGQGNTELTKLSSFFILDSRNLL